MLYGDLEIICLSTSKLVFPNLKGRTQFIWTEQIFKKLTKTLMLILGLWRAHSALAVLLRKMIITKKRMDMLAYAPVDLNSMEALAKTFIISGRQNQFIQEKKSNNAPFRRNVIAINTTSAFISSFIENPFWYQ